MASSGSARDWDAVEGAGAIDEKAWEETALDTNYTRKHLAVITKFEAGSIYQFKIRSVDSSGNIAESAPFTILAPQQQQSVFEVIMKNFEDIFGWTNRLKM